MNTDDVSFHVRGLLRAAGGREKEGKHPCNIPLIYLLIIRKSGEVYH